ncbi:MAG: AEC family transporter [Candidatus Kerfeldbacteria bacterium]|nr:AEC family transporter [Candidatus Kerfeldbacteria bacterium]
MWSIITLLLPLFALIALGYLAGYTKIAKLSWVSVLNLFGFYIAFPALIFKSLAFADISLQLHGTILLLQVAIAVGVMGLVYGVCTWLGLSKANRNTFTIGLYFSNAGYIGISALQLVYGDAAAAEGAVIVSAMILITLTFGIGLLEASKHRTIHAVSILRGIAKNPLMWATLIGFAVGFSDLTLPQPVVQFTELLAATASPTVLVALGIFIALNHPKKQAVQLASVLALGKVVMIPAVIAIVMLMLPDSHWLDTTFIQSVMPVALTAFALSEIYPMNREVVSSSIVLSVLLSFITIPLAMWLAPLL